VRPKIGPYKEELTQSRLMGFPKLAKNPQCWGEPLLGLPNHLKHFLPAEMRFFGGIWHSKKSPKKGENIGDPQNLGLFKGFPGSSPENLKAFGGRGGHPWGLQKKSSPKGLLL